MLEQLRQGHANELIQVRSRLYLLSVESAELKERERQLIAAIGAFDLVSQSMAPIPTDKVQP